MMKRIILSWIILLVSGITAVNAQYVFEGTSQYGSIGKIYYHPENQDRMFVASQGNHILQSYNGGLYWHILFSMPMQGGSMNDVKLLGDKYITFTISGRESIVYVLDYERREIVHKYNLPIPDAAIADKHWIGSYDICSSDDNVIIVNQCLKKGYITSNKVLYSKDKGATWNKVYHSNDYKNRGVNDVRVAFDDPKRVYLALGYGNQDKNGGFFASDDEGQNWVDGLEGININEAIAFDPNDSKHIFVGTGISFGAIPEALYESKDGGKTFTKADITFDKEGSLKNIVSIIYHPNKTTIYALEESEIIKSTDNGVTWTSTSYKYADPEKDYYYGHNLTVNPFNAEEFFVTGNFRCFHTKDGGTTFEKYNIPVFRTDLAFIDNSDADVDKLVYILQNGVVIKNLADKTEKLNGIERIDYGTNNTILFFNDEVRKNRIYRFIAGSTQGDFISFSDDYGKTYKKIITVDMQDGRYFGLYPGQNKAKDMLYVITMKEDYQAKKTGGTVRKYDFSNPTSVTNEKIPTPKNTEILPTCIWEDPADENHLVISGSLGRESKIFTTTDKGQNWTESSFTFPSIGFKLIQSVNDANKFFLAAADGVYITRDNCKTWKKTLDKKNVRNITRVEGRPDLVVATTHTNSNLNSDFEIIVSLNYGEKWNVISSKHLEYFNSQCVAYKYHSDVQMMTAYITTPDIGVISYNFNGLKTGIGDNKELSNEIAIAPNPATDKIYVLNALSSQIQKVQIFDLNGKLKKEVLQQNTINIQDLEHGVYLLKMLYNGKVTTQKIIKQ
ncbi:MAG: T9SS type A sorting domain-containing protein [Bacteroidales bacterium]